MSAAQSAQGPRLRLANQILQYFVPGVIVVALVTLTSALWVGHLLSTAAILRTIAVLVIACPCALRVATPVSVLAGAQRLSQLGFLIRSDEALDRASTLDTVMFDKTGTLTRGELDVVSLTIDTPDVLIWAASLEAASEHPIGAAIIREAERRSCHCYL